MPKDNPARTVDIELSNFERSRVEQVRGTAMTHAPFVESSPPGARRQAPVYRSLPWAALENSSAHRHGGWGTPMQQRRQYLAPLFGDMGRHPSLKDVLPSV